MLAVLHFMGAVLLYFITQATTFSAVYTLMLIYNLCYFPTIGLTNSLTLRNIKDAGAEFPLIRVFATIGWIVIGLVVGSMKIETSATPFLLAAGVSLAMGLYSLSLPHTPPGAGTQDVSLRGILGLDALVMLKTPSFLIFVIWHAFR